MPIRQDRIIEPLSPAMTAALSRTISPERWRTYLIAAGFDEELAQRLYLWNASIGQSFHFPLQSVEVALRNVLHGVLSAQYGGQWSTDNGCRAILRQQQLDDISKARQRLKRIHGGPPSTPQLVASLSLGFWVSLLRRDYNQSIWNAHTAAAFPNLQAGESIVTVSRTGTAIQDLRNRIFHQEPLIGHNLSEEYSKLLRMIGWICTGTREWTRRYSSVPRVIRERPR
jgi:hypothetical protein